MRLLTQKVLVFLGLLALALAGSGMAEARANPAARVIISPPEASLLLAINEARGARGLPALRVDAPLQRAARSHSRDMIRRGYFDHGAFGTRLSRFGVRGSMMGENLAASPGHGTHARRIVRMWLGSAGHRANLLHPAFRRVGIGALPGRLPGLGKVRVVTADFAAN